jgi:hypothetical protein
MTSRWPGACRSRPSPTHGRPGRRGCRRILMVAASWVWWVVGCVGRVAREGWLLGNQDSSRSRETPRYNWPCLCQSASGLFWRINQFPRRSSQLLGNAPRAFSEPRPPTQSKELPGKLLRSRSCSDGDIKDSMLNGCVRELLHDCQAISRPKH